jgi:hypothetical protein
MKKFLSLLFIGFLLSCSERPDESFSSSFILGSVGQLILPYDESITNPVLSSDENFWTARTSEKRILTKQNLEGYEEDRIILFLNPAVQEIRNIALSDDGNTALVNMATDDSKESQIIRVVFGTSDHQTFQLDGSQNKMVPNPSSLSITALTYPWDDQIVYLGTEYDELSNTAIQRLYYYNFLTDSSHVIDLESGTFSLDSQGDLEGNYYHSLDVYRDLSSPDTISEFLVCQNLESSEGTTQTFKIFDTDGNINFDGKGVYEYQEIGGIQWLGKEEILLAVKRDDQWQILSVNSAGEEHIFYEGPSNTYQFKGLDLSSSGKLCITQIVYDEYADYSDVLILSLE